MAYPVQPTLANRLIIAGHSWAALPGEPYGNTDFAQSTAVPRSDNQFGSILRDMLGEGGTTSRYITATVPDIAAGATVDTNFVIGALPEESMIEGVWFIPNAALTGAATNTREIRVGFQNWLATTPFAAYQMRAGNDFTAFTAITMAVQAGGLLTASVKFRQSDALNAPVYSWPMVIQPLFYKLSGTTQFGVPIIFTSAKVGTGHASIVPGGTVIVRLGSKYRNYAVNGSRLAPSGLYYGGWSTFMSQQPLGYMNQLEVNVNGAGAALSATTIPCQALSRPITNGSTIVFQNGVTATLTAGAGWFATSITVSAISGAIPAGTQGHGYVATGGGAGESTTPLGTHIFVWGVNDVGASMDRVAWRECVRSVIARACCPYFATASAQNVKYTNGSGAWASLAMLTRGQFSGYDPNTSVGTIQRFTGTSTSAKLDISIGPAFEGGAIDLFFLAEGGTSHGAAATITVDGATPPSGVTTINTSGASTIENTVTLPGTFSTTNTSTAATASGALTDYYIGQVVDNATNLSPGTYITDINSAGTGITLSQAAIATNAGETWVARGYVPMVKRLTGLAAGAHTVTVTLTGIDATTGAASLIFFGYGLEATDPLTPVLWCNIAKAPVLSAGAKTNADTLNADTQAVINGTTPSGGGLAGNSLEPAFDTNVVYADINAVINIAAKFFLNDGLHLNSRGNGMLARYLYGLLKNRFSTQQLLSR